MSRYHKLFLAAIVPLVLMFGTVSASASSLADARAKVPLNSFGFDPTYSPEAGKTLTYFLTFSVSKTMKVSVEYIVPSAVTKLKVNPKPTRWVHGNPVWVKKICSCGTPTKRMNLTFASGLKTGQKVKEKFIFRASGYEPYVRTVTQYVNNNNNY